MWLRMLCLLCFLVTLYTGYQFMQDVSGLVAMRQVNSINRDLLIALLNTETGQRGYIITNDSGYLAPYNSGLVTSRSILAQLDFVLKDTSQSRLMAEVDTLVQQKHEELAHTIAMRNVSLAATIKEVDSHLGKSLMDMIRVDLATIDVWASDRYNMFEDNATLFARIGFGGMIGTFLFGSMAIFRR
jgi:methyl-accepting chemotaxis protein